MFFPRLRRHAKWMFVFLALVFGLGFVVFGVGSDAGTGIGDLFRDQGVSTDSPSVEDARERLAENPNDAEAQRDLATALSTDAKTDEAIVALTRYTELRPKDASALQELAGLHLTKANRLQNEAELAQLRASYLSGGAGSFGTGLELPEGGPALRNAIEEAITTRASETVNAAYTNAQLAYRDAEDAFQKVVLLEPRDPNFRLDLAQTAQRAGDFPRAIEAYEDFLRLAPDDPNAPLVKEQIKQLKAQTAPQPG